ncbi:MAG: glycogen/starch synthase, partial [Candidatus Nanoarchaeia archaeon]
SLFDEPVLWSWAVGQLVEHTQKFFSSKKILLHAHEWLSAAALLYLHSYQPQVATVFTTHATMLGRSLSSRSINPLHFPKNKESALLKAKEIGIIGKHTVEYAAVNTADKVTTVSSITAQECRDFFEKEVFIVPNGISSHQQLTFEESSYNHIVSKRKLRKFLLEYFFPYYVFDVNNTVFFYTSGRYEFENKGIDIALEAAAKLNKRLKNEASTKTVIFFCTIIPWALKMQPQTEILENKNHLLKLYDAIEEHRQALEEQVIIDVLSQSSQPGPCIISKSLPEVFSPELITSLEKEFRRSKQSGTPALCTHQLPYDQDPILKKCFELGLRNHKDDRVKIVFIPSYLDGRDGVLDMTYLDFIQGCHLGIFPSRYEPWGYTPLESIAQAVPAITTSQTGFGRFMKPLLSQDHVGLHVVDYTQDKKKFSHDVYRILEKFVFSSKQDRVKSKFNAQEISLKASWSLFIPLYEKVYVEAMTTSLQKNTVVNSRD